LCSIWLRLYINFALGLFVTNWTPNKWQTVKSDGCRTETSVAWHDLNLFLQG
jgi:hypothetical protein